MVRVRLAELEFSVRLVLGQVVWLEFRRTENRRSTEWRTKIKQSKNETDVQQITTKVTEQIMKASKLNKPNQQQHLPVLGILPYSLLATYGSCLTGP